MSSIDLDSFVASALSDYLSSADRPATAVAEEVPAPAPVAKKKSVLKNAFTKLFDVSPKFPDFSIPAVEVHEKMLCHVPKVSSSYVVQPEEAAKLAFAIVQGDKVLMTGPTGSGKSSLVRYVCAKMGLPFIRINMSADVESAALFGQLTVRDGATVWEDGPMTEAVRYGGVVLIDEWELMPPEISMGLQNLLEDDGFLFLKEMPGSAEAKTIVPHANFRIICAGNTVGQGDDTGAFSGTSVQNSATLDRFTTTIKLDYLGAAHEKKILTSTTGVAADTAAAMIKLASLIRNAYGQRNMGLTMSPRTLINWARKQVALEDTCLAFRLAFYDKLLDNDKKAVVELYNKVFVEKFV